MLKHWIWLAQRKGIGPVGCKKLLAAFGSAEDIYQLDIARYRTMKGFRKNWEEPLMDKDLEKAEQVVQECSYQGIQVITYHDPAYPDRLKQI